MAKKQYENFFVFGARCYGMKNLWTPSTEYAGQQTKPNYLGGFMVPKTQTHWSQEPILANLWSALQKIHASNTAALDYNTPDLWPIRDGDVPQDPQQPPAEWAKGHWMFSGNSGTPIKVELTQGQNVVPLQARGNVVKPGDFVIMGGAAAVNSQNARKIKLYTNNVVFTAPGEEIAIGNSISGAELMQTARAQGYAPTGFSPSPAGGGFPGGPGPATFGQHQQQPFGAPGFSPGPGAQQQPGFAPPNGPGGFAPTPGAPAMAFPSSPAGPFAAQPFAAPAGPFGPR